MVSVIIPAYNAEATLGECLDSVLQQSQVGEVVVVDDGSTDATGAVAGRYAAADGRVRLISQANGGIAVARNSGMGVATMPFVFFADADDVVPPGALAALVAAAQEFGADMTYGDYAFLCGGETRPGPREFSALGGNPIPPRSVIASLISMKDGSVTGSCWRVLFRSEFLERTGQRFPEGVRYAEDYCFTLGCLKAGPVVAHVDRTVYLLRREGVSVTQAYLPGMEKSMDYVSGAIREYCACSDELMADYWECVTNSAWAACANLYKGGTPFDANGRKGEMKRILAKYREAIRKASAFGGNGYRKGWIIKIGAAFPSLFWAMYEIRHWR